MLVVWPTNEYAFPKNSLLFHPQTTHNMALLYFLIIGAAAGWLTGWLTKGKSFGLVGNIIIGVLGAVVGGWLFGLLGISTSGGLLGQLITAVAGALVLLWVARLFKK